MEVKKIYSVPREMAEQTGLMSCRYRMKNGSFIMSERDVSRLGLTDEELKSAGVIELCRTEARVAVAAGGSHLGDNGLGKEGSDKKDNDNRENDKEEEQ